MYAVLCYIEKKVNRKTKIRFLGYLIRKKLYFLFKKYHIYEWNRDSLLKKDLSIDFDT